MLALGCIVFVVALGLHGYVHAMWMVGVSRDFDWAGYTLSLNLFAVAWALWALSETHRWPRSSGWPDGRRRVGPSDVLDAVLVGWVLAVAGILLIGGNLAGNPAQNTSALRIPWFSLLWWIAAGALLGVYGTWKRREPLPFARPTVQKPKHAHKPGPTGGNESPSGAADGSTQGRDF